MACTRKTRDPGRPIIIPHLGFRVHERPVAAAMAEDPRRQHVGAQRLQEPAVALRDAVAPSVERRDRGDGDPGRLQRRVEEAKGGGADRIDPVGRRVGDGAAGAPVAEMGARSAPLSRPDRHRRPRSRSSAPANNNGRRAGASSPPAPRRHRPRFRSATRGRWRCRARRRRSGRARADPPAPSAGAPRRSATALARATASGVRLSSLAISRISMIVRSSCARPGLPRSTR